MFLRIEDHVFVKCSYFQHFNLYFCQMGVVGELVQVECEAVSAPPPSGVIWTFMGRTIDTGESWQ